MKKCIRAMLIVILSTALVSCAAPGLMNTVKPGEMETDSYVQKAENFMVILDASGSMLEKYEGEKKLYLARESVSLFNRTIPDIELTGALRTFGQSYNPFKDETLLLYGLTHYSKAAFQDALEPVWGGSRSPLWKAMDAASEDLSSASERIALIIFSDAKDMDNSPVESAKAMKSKYGERLCIYTVLVGDDPAGKTIMEDVAGASACGFAVSVKGISTSSGMADFVERVFFEKGMRPADSDDDGVYDDKDKCPETPKGATVNEVGCRIDSDGDGVYDDKDKCPGTPKGSTVNEVGCRIDSDGDGVYDDDDRCPDTLKGATVNAVGCWVLKGLRFDTAKWNIKPAYHSLLNELVTILEKNPSLRVEIQGHTDSRGSADFNQTLSENRAGSVMDYLIEKGIAKDRLTAKGFGLSRPVASNDTPEGMMQNRRVELKPVR